jgi:thiamine-monophosphate kinase
VTAALSDLAAMAALPVGVLVALALPSHWQTELDAIADGVADAAEAARTRIVGGNIAAAGQLSLTTCVLGSAFGVLARDGLSVGQTLYVTGRLGAVSAAVRAWKSGQSPAPEHRARFAHPSARLREARWLAQHGATAAIDISDGLVADLEHLAAASDVAIEVDLGSLPVVDGVSCLDAAGSGEEYELVVGASEPLGTDEFRQELGLPLTAIGRVAARGASVVLTRDGARVAKPSGYDHLSA